MKRFLLSVLFIPSFSLLHAQQPQIKELEYYLEKHGSEPESYIINKFKDHDYIFIGEYHRIKHDVDLILSLIPLLNKNGICNLAIEFGAYQYQNMVDSLLGLPYFDRELADLIMFKTYPVWGYKEYIDIYKVAWEVNHSPQAGKTKFRIINVGCLYDPCPKDHFGGFDPDVYMADVILKEIVARKQKALVYSGCHHAFTKYHQPLYDFNKDKLYGLNNTRMGNVIYDSLKEKTFNIYLHAGWISNKGFDSSCVLPVNGIIDSVMTYFPGKRLGFDIVNSPFGKLRSDNSYYAFGYPDFTLDKFCDGYIFQKPFNEYQPITMENNFITENNIHDLKKHLQCIGWNSTDIQTLSVENANTILFEDIRDHFKHLMK